MSCQIIHDEFKNIALSEMNKMFDRVPLARGFHAGEFTNKDYYTRHLLETILRIRFNNEVDAYCLYKISYKDIQTSVFLARYLSEEIGHEGYFMKDLYNLGLTKEQVDISSPFFSTEILMGYIYYSINRDGALPTMAWSWFVEWYSDTYNSKITNKAAKEFGVLSSSGFTEHIDSDTEFDHLGLMFSMMEQNITAKEDCEKLKKYVVNFIKLIGDYFQELYDETIKTKKII